MLATEARVFARHEQYVGRVNAPAARVFELLDDQMRLSDHMSKRSWKLGWGKMDMTMDAQNGHAVGSRITLAGRVFGVWLALDEVVVEREPPLRKSWETVGEPRLLVIGPYRMGFTLARREPLAELRVTIDYDLPRRGVSAVLGRLFGPWYAKWCTRRMVEDARHAFAHESGKS